jgi:RHS repeat-associated protein
MSQRSETTYDAIGHVKETKDFNGDVIKYGYDQQNQLISKQFVGEGNRIETYNTAADARSQTVTDTRGTTSYAYDEQGRLLSKTEPDGAKISYIYDPVTGKIASVTTPSGTAQYRYNGLGQLVKVISTEGETIYTYNLIGNLKTKNLPNGIIETYEYDDLNRIKSIVQKNATGAVLASYNYNYDPVGNKTKVEELSGRVASYTYDELYRLTKEAIVDPVHGNRTIEYVYDAVGNRLLKKDTTVGDIVYRYNQNDWIMDASTGNIVSTVYAYDNNGNTKTKIYGTETTKYTWDTQNHLTGASIEANGQTQQLSYEYNFNGVRTKSIVNGVETRYLLDENRQYAEVLEEYDNSGVQSRYVYGAELDLISQTRNSSISFYLEDSHSGVRQLTSSIGAVTDQYSYDSYGNIIYSAGSTQNVYQYRGEQSDLSLGMQYLRARYYDSKTGRLYGVDPHEGVQKIPFSRHRYLYGNSNPVSYTDPSGKDGILGTLAVPSIAAILEGVSIFFGAVYLTQVLTALKSPNDSRWDATFTAQTKIQVPLQVRGIDATNYDFVLQATNGRFAGEWLVISLGAGVSSNPFSNLFEFEAEAEGVIFTPSLPFAKTLLLTGEFNAAHVSVPGYSGKGFLIGFGKGYVQNIAPDSSNQDIGLPAVDLSAYTGFSIPIIFPTRY